ncbi:TetR/AcrR family transcriptional regulator [Kineococcus sp. TBRC 1896]|uniref:TetR/AcrR family transcriptional regulator n=1 Tax=Kineococcus mangrovi TaxID=1660183 RepID=A0ABV4HZ38_9ACTN
MARPRAFDVPAAITAAGEVFARLGYSATSIDDLVNALGLHRGSLYQAFGSKRGLFLAALHQAVHDELPQAGANVAAHPDTCAKELIEGPALDLLLVGALELAPSDAEIRDLVATACTDLDQHFTPRDGPPAAELLGRRLLRRAQLDSFVPH